jgi:hypothetical protein
MMIDKPVLAVVAVRGQVQDSTCFTLPISQVSRTTFSSPAEVRTFVQRS